MGSQLTSLELSRCSGVPAEALGALLGGFGQLTALDLSGCLTVGDGWVHAKRHGSISLEDVNYHGLAVVLAGGVIVSLLAVWIWEGGVLVCCST